MKRLLMFFAAVVLIVVGSNAALPLKAVSGLSATQRPLGYTVTDSITVEGAAFGTAGTYTIGAVLTPAQLSAYQGCTIVGVRYAVSQSLGRTRAFVSQVEGNTVTTLVEQNQRAYAGWNNVFFNSGNTIEITGEESFFFGFDYVETAEMIAADEGALDLYGDEDIDNAFCLYGNYGSGVGIYSVSGGALCVQLIIDVSNLPDKELNFTYFDTGFRYKKPGEDVEFLAILNNTGMTAVSEYVVGCQIGDQAPIYYNVNENKPLAEGGSAYCEQVFTIPEDIAVGQYELKLFVHSVDGIQQTRHLNDTISTLVNIYRQAFPRQQHLIEMYTHEQSPYVPYVDACFKKLMDMKPKACMVNVAAPTTMLALPEANYLHALYAYTYPSFTLDRSYFPGEAYIAYDVNDYVTVIPELIPSMISDMLLQEDMNPAFASVMLEPSFDADTRTLTLSITGDVADDAAALFGDLALTVMLTENGVIAPQMVYNESTQRSAWNQNYQHDHVLRAFLSAPVGDKLTVNGGSYTAQYTATLSNDWVADNMTVIAFVTRAADSVTDENVIGMDITNANSVNLKDIGSTDIPVSTIVEDATSIEVFDIQGRRMSADWRRLPRGMYVVKQGKTIKKIMKP